MTDEDETSLLYVLGTHLPKGVPDSAVDGIVKDLKELHWAALTAPLPEELAEIERRHEYDHKEFFELGEMGEYVAQAHTDRATLLRAYRALQAEVKEAVEKEREACAKVADDMATAINNRTTRRLEWAEFCQEEMVHVAEIIRARKETENA